MSRAAWKLSVESVELEFEQHSGQLLIAEGLVLVPVDYRLVEVSVTCRYSRKIHLLPS